MSFVQTFRIGHSFGDRRLLSNISVALQSGTRAALAGANGSGKTTFLRMLAGQIPPDEGEIVREKTTRVSYLPQSGVSASSRTLRDEFEKAFLVLSGLERDLRRLEDEMEKAGSDEGRLTPLIEQHHHIAEILEDAGYHRREESIHRVAIGLGFQPADLERACSVFSGGWQMRIALARVLLENPDILLLDEPTNYLDLEARNWLEDFIRKFKGGLLIVSHDRYFLDSTIGEVWELFMGTLKRYTGTYTEYEKKRELELEALHDRYRRNMEERERIDTFIRRFRYNSSKAAMVQSRIKQLEKMEVIEVPETLKRMKITFPKAPHSGNDVVRIRGLTKKYGPKTVLADFELGVSRGEKLVLVGPNGAGKSTLMRILASRDKDHGGSVNFGAGVKSAYFSQDLVDQVNSSRSVWEEAESACPFDYIPRLRNLLGAFLFRGDDIDKPVSVLSGGEMSRLVLLKLLLSPVNLLLLDEPTNHLDLISKDVLLDALRGYDGTVVFVSHDRGFISGLATNVLDLSQSPPAAYPGGYDAYLARLAAAGRGAAQTADGVGKADASANTAASKKTDGSAARGVEEAGRGRAFQEQSKQARALAKKLEKREHEILARLETLEAETREKEELLSKPEIYQDGAAVRTVKERLAAIEAETAALHAEWESVEAEKAKLLG